MLLNRSSFLVSLLTLGMLLSVFQSNAQLTGTKTVGGGSPDYLTLAQAIDSINTLGVGAGGLIVEVAAGHTEVMTNKAIVTTTTSSANPLIIRKNGTGANPLFTAGAGVDTSDAFIFIAGTDYVTISGLDFAESVANTTIQTRMEWGIAVLKQSGTEGSQFVNINGCNITLNKANTYSVGIYSGNHTLTSTTALILSAFSGTNSNLRLENNTISNVYNGISVTGAVAQSAYDINNVITGNAISDFGGSATVARGIYVTNQQDMIIRDNGISGGNGTTAELNGIYAQTGISSNITIRKNNITLFSSATTSNVYGINNGIGNTAAGNTVSIDSNQVFNCVWNTASSGDFYAINNSSSAALINIFGNKIYNNRLVFSSSGITYMIYNQTSNGTNPVHIYRNEITGNTKSGSSGACYLIRASTATLSVTDNIIANDSILTGTGSIYAYYNAVSPVTETYTGNHIYHIINNGTGATYGIYLTTASGLKTVSRNQIYDLKGNSTVIGFYGTYGSPLVVSSNEIYGLVSMGGSAVVTGMQIGSPSSMVYNNYIYDLAAPVSSAPNAVIGLTVSAGTTHNINHNTIAVWGTSSVNNFGSSAVSVSSATPTVIFRNNIFSNNTTPTGTGFAVAYRRSAAVSTNYSDSSNGNIFYAGNLTGRKCIYYDGTNADSSLSAYKTRMATRDQASLYELPPFLSISTPPYNLHINTTQPTQVESKGVAISWIGTDFDNDTRNAGTPDIGADEGSFTPQDAAPPLISAGGISNTSSLSNRTLNSYASITDPSGIDTLTGFKPRIYFKKKSDANAFNGNTSSNNGWKYTESLNTTSPFSFNIDYNLVTGGGVSVWDTIQYFVVAQDKSPLVNVASIPATGFTGTSVGTITSAPSAPLEYIIISAPVSGNFTVGSGGTYTTITQAINFLRTVGISGHTTLEFISSQYDTLSETFPIVIKDINGAGSNATITMKPALNNTVSIVAKADAAFILDGIDYVTIDGSANGTTSRDMTIKNVSTSTTSSVIWIRNGASRGAAFNTVKNVNVYGNTNATTLCGIGLGSPTISVSSRGTDLDNNTIENCDFRFAQYGIYSSGLSAANKNRNNRFNNNTINSPAPANIMIAGILASFEDSLQIIGNHISGMSRSTDVAGIILGNNLSFGSTTTTGNEVSNVRISKNKIDSVVSTGAFSSAGIYVSPASAGVNMIDNNVISGVRGNATGTDIVAGIMVVGDTGAVRIYHNTISMSGSGTRSSPSYALAIGGKSHPVDIRNNILVNTSTTSGANYSYALGFNYSNFTGVISDKNIFYTTGANAKLFVAGDLDGGTEYNSLSAWQSASGTDGASLNINPLLVSEADLRIDLSSPAMNSGVAISSVNTDITNITRHVSSPSIGAYETGVDFTAPSISSGLLGNTTSVLNRVLTGFATITDGRGINTTSGTAPRIYYKKKNDDNVFGANNSATNGWKWAEATNTTSPFSFEINYSLLTGPVAIGDTINYFIAAQDNSSNANTGSFPIAGFSATSVGTINTAPTSPASYIIIDQPMHGSYTVGTAGVFPTLTVAANNLRLRGMDANVELSVGSNITEPAAVVFPQITEYGTGNYTLTIKPSVTATISADANNSGVLVLAGTDRVMIDGRIGVASTNELTIINLSTTATTKAGILIASSGTGQGCNNVTVRNVNLEMNNIAATGVSAIQAQGDNNDSLTLINNRIKKASIGINIFASTAAGTHQHVLIDNNMIGSSVAGEEISLGGIRVSHVSAVISSNDIRNITRSASSTVYGIQTGDYTAGTRISKNRIHGITSTYSTLAGAYGINLSGTNSASNIEVNNNIISKITRYNYSTSSTEYNPFGIRISGGTSHRIIHNSVNLYGASATVGTAGTLSAAFMVTSASCDSLVVLNNIFANKYQGLSGSKSYAVYSVSGVWYSDINNNNYDTTGAATFGRIGYAGSEVNTLPAFRVLTGRDLLSVSVNSRFANDSNLMVVSSSTPSQIESGGALTSVVSDFNGDPRPKTVPTSYGGNTAPDIGAYEFDGAPADFTAPVISYTALPLATTSTGSRILNGFAAISDLSSGVDSITYAPRCYYKKKSDNNTYNGNTSADNGWKYAVAGNQSTPFGFVIDYSILNGGNVAVGDTIQYFVTAQDIAGNVSALPSSGFSATSVNTITTFPSSPEYYIIVGAPMSGTYTVGSAGNFSTITEAANNLRLRGVNGAVTLSLTNPSYGSGEVFPIDFTDINGVSALNTITMKPATGIDATVTGSGSAIIKLTNTSYVTIDGSNNGTNSRNLSLTNTANTTNTAVVWISGTTGSSHNTIKNTNLSAGVDQSAATLITFGILINGATVSTTSLGVDNDSNTIENNFIIRTRYGIFISGQSATNPNERNVIRNNIIGPNAFGSDQIGRAGIVMHNSIYSVIAGNEIRNIGTLISDVAAGSDKAGIALATDALWTPTSSAVYGSRITNNRIYNIVDEKTNSAVGIIIAGTKAGDSTGNIVSNNFIAQIRSNGTSTNQAVGIGMAAGNSDSIIHNTISLSGDLDPFGSTTATVSAYGLRISSTTVEHPFIRNNIIRVDVTSNTGTLLHGAANIPSTFNWGNGGMNKNNLSIDGTNSQMRTASIGTTFYASLQDWSTASGRDQNSVNRNVQFVSPTDLHLTGTSVNDTFLITFPVAGFMTDIDGENRHFLPYLGADELPGAPLPVTLIGFNGKYNNANAELTWRTTNEYNNSGFELQVSADGQSFVPVTFVNARNQQGVNDYQYTDSRPFTKYHVSKLYYRLKQVDLNGDITYSHVVMIEKSVAASTTVNVYPNPFDALFNVSVISEVNSSVAIEVRDINGKLVKTAESLNREITIDLSGENTGIYFVRIISGNEVKTVKVIKN